MNHTNQHTLLLVDDNFDNIELLEEILKAQGYNTLTALTGFDAIRLAVNQQPDLILLDIAMPVMDGMEVLEVLKSDQDTATIPVMFVTGIMENEKILRALQDGLVVDYISKPIIVSELLDKITAHIGDAAKKL
jgi:CheY-like chemotaxis protein